MFLKTYQIIKGQGELTLVNQIPGCEQEAVRLENFKEINSDQYNEEGGYTAGFGFRNLIIPRNDEGLNHS